MRKLQLAAALLVALSSFATTGCLIHGCKGDDPQPAEESVQVSYAQTYCSDPWGQAQTTQQLEAAAAAYLQQRGITATDVMATATNPPQVCNACSCKSGVVLQANVRPQDVAAMLALGFTQ